MDDSKNIDLYPDTPEGRRAVIADFSKACYGRFESKSAEKSGWSGEDWICLNGVAYLEFLVHLAAVEEWSPKRLLDIANACMFLWAGYQRGIFLEEE
jgi:hypothetical protein